MQIYRNILTRVENDDLDANGRFIVPEEVKEVACSALMFCNKKVREFVMQEGVESIEDFSFFDCDKLEQLNLPKSMKNIGELAFFNCFNLKGLEIPEGVENIGNGVFTGCESLETVIIPNSIKKIGKDLFYGCSALKRIAIPSKFEDKLEDILGYYATQKNDLEILLTEPIKGVEKGE